MTEKPCPECNNAEDRVHDCQTCDGTGVDLAEQLNQLVALAQSGGGELATTSGTRAHELARADDPFLVPRWSSPPERLAEIDEHQLTHAFAAMAKLPPPPAATDGTTRQREAIGRAMAEYLASVPTGTDADLAATHVVAAVGAAEAFMLADVLGKWAAAIAVRAERAERAGLRR